MFRCEILEETKEKTPFNCSRRNELVWDWKTIHDCNVDAAIFPEFRDSTGQFIRTRSNWYQGRGRVTTCSYILGFSEIHLQNIIFETDCKANVDVLNLKSPTQKQVLCKKIISSQKLCLVYQ